MSDASSIVPWITALLGCAVSFAMARRRPRERSVLTVAADALKACALGIALIFVAALLHSLCMDPLHRCVTHGDANVAYVVVAIVAIPAYWLIMVFGSPDPNDIESRANGPGSAAANAVIEYCAGKTPSTCCPNCHQVISVTPQSSSASPSSVLTQCACQKCNGKFKLGPSEA
jgi:predicted acyltransferase